MMFREVFDRFVKESPVSVMLRATLEHSLTAEFVDQLFREHAVRQRESSLLFATIVDLMAVVVCGVRPSLHATHYGFRDQEYFVLRMYSLHHSRYALAG